MQTNQDANIMDGINSCCSGTTSAQGYTTGGFNPSPSAMCTLCKLNAVVNTTCCSYMHACMDNYGYMAKLMLAISCTKRYVSLCVGPHMQGYNCNVAICLRRGIKIYNASWENYAHNCVDNIEALHGCLAS